jgi:endoglycosylceramidase
VLARPYPRAVAGTPLRWRFDPASRAFELEYVATDGETEVFIPPRHYPAGYEVRVEGADAVAETRLLRLSGAGRVKAQVSPRGSV